jgi:hypothetical protein
MSVTPNPANLLMHLLVDAIICAIPATCLQTEGKKEPGVHPLPAFGGITRIVGLVPSWQFAQDQIAGKLFCLAAIPS